MVETCPYCTDTSVTERIIVEDKFAKAFPTNMPIVPGHLLIVPKRHVATYGALSPDEVHSIYGSLRKKLEKALITLFRAEGFNYAWNEGGVAGQSVQHFHLHILPRKEGDAGITEYEPRKFLYRPGSREQSPDAELLAVVKEIKKAL